MILNILCIIFFVQAKASLVTPVLSLTTPSNLAAGGSFVSALPTGFATGNVQYVTWYRQAMRGLVKCILSMKEL